MSATTLAYAVHKATTDPEFSAAVELGTVTAEDCNLTEVEYQAFREVTKRASGMPEDQLKLTEVFKGLGSGSW